MALQENKVKKTPEEIKKARALRIRDRAATIYPSLLIMSYDKLCKAVKVVGGDPEMIRATWQEDCQMAAAQAIEASVKFNETWDMKKGQFLADE